MILSIVGIVLVVLGGIGLFLYEKNKHLWNFLGDLWFCGVSTIFAATGLTMSIVCFSYCLASNCPHTCKMERIDYEAKVNELTATYTYLNNLDDNKDKYTAIQQYNAEVNEFKTNILKHQSALKNPWINWLHCKEYKNFDANVVSYIEVK